MDIETLLKEGNQIEFKVCGFSMYPVLRPGKDWVRVVPVRNKRMLKRGDVALFRRKTGMLVLHRIYKVEKEGFYFVGDNQEKIEGPIEEQEILGKMVAFTKTDMLVGTSKIKYKRQEKKWISVRSISYCMWAKIWLFVRPLRPLFRKIWHFTFRQKNDKI